METAVHLVVKCTIVRYKKCSHTMYFFYRVYYITVQGVRYMDVLLYLKSCDLASFKYLNVSIVLIQLGADRSLFLFVPIITVFYQKKKIIIFVPTLIVGLELIFQFSSFQTIINFLFVQFFIWYFCSFQYIILIIKLIAVFMCQLVICGTTINIQANVDKLVGLDFFIQCTNMIDVIIQRALIKILTKHKILQI
eukprot:TRINITY_DN11851_c0_g1_i1.p1 TRINITY_DN11851_c0_g1~~TRINITY_DN11851_c0_g1_i1.p1  ORF type:complete len:194 (-),score=-13.18 TRINITY_DN11851_c0_g1_i1:86-667(-)